MACERLSRVVPALLLPLAVSGAFFGVASTAGAEGARPPHAGVAILMVVDRVSFEEVMAVPEFRALARAGGAALMATDGSYRSNARDAYWALGSGADPRGAPPHLLARTLLSHGVAVCTTATSSSGGSTNLIPSTSPGLFLGAAADDNCRGLVPGVSALFIDDETATVQLDQRAGVLADSIVEQRRAAALARIGRRISDLEKTAPNPGDERVLVMFVTPSPSSSMNRVGDEVTPVVMGEGAENRLLTKTGSMHALTSDTTRFDGMVSNVDVAPTILTFFGIDVPSQMDGQPISATGAAAPFALHRLHLEQRRVRLPIQLGALAFVVVIGALAIASLIALGVRGTLPGRAARAMRFLVLCGVALPLSMLAGGLLPRLTYAWTVPFLVITAAVLAWLALTVPGRGPLGAFTFLGAVGAGFLVLDTALGGRALRIPLLGGTMFDGVRYYGLPNAFIALLLASALFLAHRLRPYPGFVLLIAAALFAGFPSLGADIGGAVTLFAAAGAWWVLRTRPRIGVREFAFAVGVVAVGLGAVLLANRYFPGAPTHATRFVEESGKGFGSAWREIRHRLGVGWGQIRAVPASWIPLIGLPVVLGFVLAAPGPIRRGLDLEQGWRGVVVVLVLASIVAYVANDTGVAAAAPGFLYAMAAITFPALTWSMAEGGRDAPRAARPLTALGGRP